MRSTRNRRQFQWVRVAGAFPLVDTAAGNGSFGAADLLLDARTQYGQLLDAGATVMSIKGYVKPNMIGPGTDDGIFTGALGIRRCSRSDVSVPREEDSPTGSISEDEPFMYFNPWFVFLRGAESTPAILNEATSDPGTHWAVNVRSHRKLPQLSQTLGLFVGSGQTTSDFEYIACDYHLSLGMKLP